MRCSNCGNEVRQGAKFCNHCGADLSLKPAGSKPNRVRKILIAAILSVLCLVILICTAYFTGVFDRLHLTNSNAAAEENTPELPELQETPEPTEMPATPELYNVYEQLPEEFVFTSGAGGWATIIQLQDDGSFTGRYTDWNPSTGPDNPNGESYICSFSGRLSPATKISEYVYSAKLEELTQERPTGEVYYEDGIKYTCADPYGFDDADEFLIFLPGVSLPELPEEFRGWVQISKEITTMPEGLFGLYNVSGQEGFSAVDEHSVWTAAYECSVNGNRVSFGPNYSMPSRLTFFVGGGPSVWYQSFVWSGCDQTVFQASDWEKTSFSTITIAFSEDRSTASLTVETDSSRDLSPWGGTTDGKLSLQLTRTESR